MNNLSIVDRDIVKIFLSLIIVSAIILVGVGIERDFIVQLDGEELQVSSAKRTIGEALEDIGIEITEGYYISQDLNQRLKGGMEIEVLTPKAYTIIADGQEKQIISPFMKVEDILNDINFEMSELDITEPAKKEIAKNTITVKRLIEKLEEKVVEVDFDVEVEQNEELSKGIEHILEAGEKGEKQQQIKHIYVDDQLEESIVYNEKLIKEPKTQKVEIGTKTTIATSRGNANFSKSIIMNASAYDISYESTGKHPGHPYYGITASGTRAKRGTVAVDPRVIPLGTKLYVQSLDAMPDYGFATAEDTGGAINGNKIDLLMDSRQECRTFGRRNVKVYILD